MAGYGRGSGVPVMTRSFAGGGCQVKKAPRAALAQRGVRVDERLLGCLFGRALCFGGSGLAL